MSKVRLFLIFLFAGLSLYFGYLALTRPRENLAKDSLRDLRPWGRETIAFARKFDMPIFFELKGYSFVSSPRIDGIVKKYYVQSVLDPEAYPADYRALQRLFAMSGASGEPRVGILSSRGFPLYLTSALVYDSNIQTNEDAAIIGALNAYVKHRARVKSGVSIAVKVAAQNAKISEYPMLFRDGGGLAALENLKMIFSANAWAKVSAIYTENCRMAARISAGNHSMLALEVRDMALQSLLEQDFNSLQGYQKLLVARALSEFVFVCDSPSAKKRFFEILSDIEKSVNKDGFFETNSLVKARDNALLLSLYARAYKMNKGADYLSKISKLSKNLSARVSENYIYPSVLFAGGKKIKSEASAIDYSLLARGFLDSYLATKDYRYLKDTLNTMTSFDVEFADSGTGSWFTNAKSSIFAESFRFKEESDFKYPSGVGEGAQVLADVYSLRGEVPERLFKILSPLNSYFNYKYFDKSSIKLSMLANPML